MSNGVSHDYITKRAAPPQDASAVDAIASVQGMPAVSVLLARFIKEIQYFSPSPDARRSGPTGMPLRAEYQAEKLNPMHKFWRAVTPEEKQELEKAVHLVGVYLASLPHPDKGAAAGFAAWLATQESADRAAVIALVNSWKDIDPVALANTADNDMVKYLDMVMRQKYVIEVGPDGRLYSRIPGSNAIQFRQEVFDTSDSFVSFGGRNGRAIWVQGPSGRFYSSKESDAGKFHHSSFLAGREVKAAGDWDVDGGTLMSISAISGHYLPPLVSLRGALLDLRASCRQTLSATLVEVYKGGVLTMVPAEEFLAKSGTDRNYLNQFTPVR